MAWIAPLTPVISGWSSWGGGWRSEKGAGDMPHKRLLRSEASDDGKARVTMYEEGTPPAIVVRSEVFYGLPKNMNQTFSACSYAIFGAPQRVATFTSTDDADRTFAQWVSEGLAR